MMWFVSCIIRGVYEQNNIVKNVPVDDCTGELAIIARNGQNDTSKLIRFNVTNCNQIKTSYFTDIYVLLSVNVHY